MPRRKPPPNPSASLRRHIAAAAARLMAEDGIADYGLAKRKAAKALGADDGETLPTNAEIEEALREYQELFQDDEQAERLREMRATALEVMELTAEFRPYLTGSVLDGTAGRFSTINIDLHADSAKDVEIMLLNHRLEYDAHEPRQRTAESPETVLEIVCNDIPVNLAVFPLALERMQRRSPHNGRHHLRANTAAVAALLQQSP